MIYQKGVRAIFTSASRFRIWLWLVAVVSLWVVGVSAYGTAGSPGIKEGGPGEPVPELLRLGEQALEEGRFEDAVRLYRRALKVEGDSARGHYGLGLALGRQGKLSEALVALQEAVRLNPSWPEARRDLGVAYVKLKRWPEADRTFRAYLKLRPGDPEGHYHLGLALGQQGRHQEAKAAFEEALRLKPDYLKALNNLGLALLKLNHWPEAQSIFEKAVRLDSANPEAHLGLWACAVHRGDQERASREYLTLKALNPDLARRAEALLKP